MDHKITTTTSVVSYLTSVTGFVASLSISEKVALGHLAIAICTFLINWIYKRRHFRLAAMKATSKQENQK
tara:strand:- start:484 stop:693 length:210 start_codon:yes stop_codon:yes gene_type:complete